jgi:aspartate carbamoyltransferase catalytic subunit
MRAVTSLAAFSAPELERVLDWTEQPPAQGAPLAGRVVAVLALGPTVPSPGAWIAAAGRLGATVLRTEDLDADPDDGFALTAEAARWADLLVVSHPDQGFARAVARTTGLPVVSAGETLGDDVAGGVSLLAVMRSRVQRALDLRVAVCGDLEGSRSVRALLGGLAALGAAVVLVPAQGRDLQEDELARLARRLGGRPKFCEIGGNL